MELWKQKVIGEIKNANYYIYEHYLDNKLFYIGKGSGERCFHYKYRSHVWKNIVNNRENEVIVKIKKTFENENEALRFEKYRIIRMSKKYNLTNIVYNSKIEEYERYLTKINATSDKLHINKKVMKSVGQKVEILKNLIMNLDNYNKNVYISRYVNQIDNEKATNENAETMKEKIEYLRKVHHNNALYLSEIIKKEKLKFGSNNLILAPAGSGKTTLIKKLINSGSKKILILVSNNALKDSMSFSDNEAKGNAAYKINIMSYVELGKRIEIDKDFLKDIKQIFCDEIHSLISYQQVADSSALYHAMETLFTKHEGKEIFYFTTTDEYLNKVESEFSGIFNNVVTFDYRNYPEIKQYISLSKYKFSHIEHIRPHLQSRIEEFNLFGYKCLAFNRTISGQYKIAEISKEEGFKPLILWSINNEEFQMDKEQLKAREHLLNYGIIPDPYNFLIINSAMQEGWDLKDERVKLAIMNTTSETEYVQALGRLRKDVDVLLYKSKNNEADVHIDLPARYFNKPLASIQKEELCIELNIVDDKGRLLKWTSIKKILEKQGYKIKDHTKNIDGKQTRVSTINIE